MDFTLNNFAKTSANWLFPKKCIVCKQAEPQDNHPCCTTCYLTLPFQTHACAQCGQRFAANSDHCGRCINKPPSFDACFCPFEYQGVIKTQIQNFKYHEQLEIAPQLAQLMEYELHTNGIELPDILIPVPLHISRLRSRGYNQSQLLANALAKRLNIPVDNNIIAKHRKTSPQAELSLKKRSNNLKSSFKIKKRCSLKSVAIIDDVVTTGSTANEIAKTLKKNGVNYIQVWGLAHTI